ncbi:hypothetical protein [Pandoraea communis]|uniref:Uncharacterized protein n=1 Tax=Pandoraea communis TaxID=2508297 RepID=A0A5E4UL63_9BURK|nr:hypothetical protein [Pandoraea communis]MDM8359608.1 hypothetical protein [Pandoraea communis]VVD99039.1 hypothetical protein PCO31111_02048 [Pandoraea communis]
MFKITVKTMRSTTFSLVAACFAGAAQADMTGIAGAPVPVSDMLLASTRAANLQQSVVANLSGATPVVVVPVNATITTTTANNVRLWDEVIPPAPAPKPTQASATLPVQPRLAVTASAYSPNSLPSLAPGLQTTSLKVNVSVGRVPVGIPR